MNASLQIDLFVLLLAAGGMLLTVWLNRRFPMQSWFENRVAWLFPKDLGITMETLAACIAVFSLYTSRMNARRRTGRPFPTLLVAVK